ncbi:hypothetical protein JOF53_007020 [Crossiella equi]|uniref:DUF4190 domain-containing protein n=1 Tax=Crossiella equi TaxID=130796 RepID=A0ABS5ANJ8_9PSEU|nr:DUF4190 domain-containing protein [Crossiella equi]MBP2478148.1 hypothetical protein [Crossiella equi]
MTTPGTNQPGRPEDEETPGVAAGQTGTAGQPESAARPETAGQAETAEQPGTTGQAGTTGHTEATGQPEAAGQAAVASAAGPTGYPAPPAYAAPPGYAGQPYAQAPPGYPSPYGPGGAYDQSQRRLPAPGNVNGFAIAALVLGILGNLLLLGIIFGFVALSQIRRRGDSGKGMAVAGIVTGSLWVCLIVVGVVVSASMSARLDANGQVVESGRLSVFQLDRGHCFDGISDRKEAVSVTAQPCTDPHQAEVLDRFTVSGGSGYPGVAKVQETVDEECSRRVPAKLSEGPLADRLEMMYFYPTAESWRRGDRNAVCVAVGVNGTKLTEPLPR